MKSHLYHKNKCDVWDTNYKSHFVCFSCKISWKKKILGINKNAFDANAQYETLV
jgi:hypothetical protein